MTRAGKKSHQGFLDILFDFEWKLYIARLSTIRILSRYIGFSVALYFIKSWNLCVKIRGTIEFFYQPAEHTPSLVLFFLIMLAMGWNWDVENTVK